MDLIQYINTKIKLTAEESAIIGPAFKEEFCPKGTILAHPHNHSQKIHFIEKGLIRLYYNKDGKDITHFFFDENSFAACAESVYFDKPSPYGKEVLVDSMLRTIHLKDLNLLLNRFEAFKDLSFIVAVEVIGQLSDRLNSIQFQSAEERYKFIIDKHPNILLRVPLGHIASYLGITQQTLSVIRAKI
jgi:hypothetical protein